MSAWRWAGAPLKPLDTRPARSRASIAALAGAPVVGYGHSHLRVGLLGGSFNPAHAGHRHLSLEALRRLGLDQVWWLVSPQNPLKSVAGMAPFADRLEGARRVANHPRLIATDLEQRLGTVYSADTLAALCRLFPRLRFVWLMGADNLTQIHRWRAWRSLFQTVPIAVFARPGYSMPALIAPAARRFAAARLPERLARALADQPVPGWTFLHIRLNSLSATRIRAATRSTTEGG